MTPAAVLGVGCQPDQVIVTEILRNDQGMIVPGPFAPDTMRVHPLTHAERVEGEQRIVVHMELTDGWGDTVKGTGTVRIALERLGGRALSDETTAWDIDLSEISASMAYFDPVTRTYKFVLTGLPGWFAGGERGRLRVLYRTARGDGTVRVMRDVFEVGVSINPVG